MGKYLQLLDRAAVERRRDKSDQSDKRSPGTTGPSPFGRLCRFDRSPDPATTDIWGDAQEERAAIVEYESGVPWAEGFARLDPNKPPADVPAKRWLHFIDDCGRFLDAGWADKAVALGWGPLDLFGADRERPFARIDHMGLLWLCKGGTIIELYRDRAVLKTQSGTRQTYRRRPVEVGRVVLAWDADAET